MKESASALSVPSYLQFDDAEAVKEAAICTDWYHSSSSLTGLVRSDYLKTICLVKTRLLSEVYFLAQSYSPANLKIKTEPLN